MKFFIWRGGREAEGTRLLSEYTPKGVSRVRIPASPFFKLGEMSELVEGARLEIV